MPQRQRQTVAVARGEQLVLIVISAVPDRADGVMLTLVKGEPRDYTPIGRTASITGDLMDDNAF